MGVARLPRHQVTTRFLHVPAIDWPRVKIGEKTEFRTSPREGSRIITCNLPTPVVVYSKGAGAIDMLPAKLMVLTHRSFEPLFNIAENPEAIAREGFPDYDHFRRYWRARNKGVYRPMQRVWVWRVREFTENDVYVLGTSLLRELYGEHLPEALEVAA